MKGCSRYNGFKSSRPELKVNKRTGDNRPVNNLEVLNVWKQARAEPEVKVGREQLDPVAT